MFNIFFQKYHMLRETLPVGSFTQGPVHMVQCRVTAHTGRLPTPAISLTLGNR